MSMQICLPDNIDIVALFADCDIDFNDPVIFPKKRSDEYIEWQEREAERQNKKIERARQYYWEHLEYYREYEKKRRAKQSICALIVPLTMKYLTKNAVNIVPLIAIKLTL